MDSLMQLTLCQDRLSYLCLEKGRIEQDAKSVAYVTENQRVPVPAADLASLAGVTKLPPRYTRYLPLAGGVGCRRRTSDRRLRDNLAHHAAVNIGQAKVTACVAECQTLVVDAQ